MTDLLAPTSPPPAPPSGSRHSSRRPHRLETSVTVAPRLRRLAVTALIALTGAVLPPASAAAAVPAPAADRWSWDAPGWGWQFTPDGYWHTSPHGTFHVDNVAGYRAPGRHRALGGGTGVLGYPTSALTEQRGIPQGISTGRFQQFERGVVYDSAYGTFVTLASSSITDLHRAQGGGTGATGYPTSEVVQEATGWSYQRFAVGVVYSSPRGTFSVLHGFDRNHRAEGGGRVMGYPTTPERLDAPGYSWQLFERGAVYCQDQCYSVMGDFRGVHDSRGGGTGSLGYPLSLATYDGAKRTWFQQFERGAVLSGPGGLSVVPGRYRF